MKKILLLASIIIVSAGCVPFGGYTVDWAPVEITIQAYDADGNSIISPEMPGMTLTYKGDIYTVQDPQNYQIPTKDYLAILYGLYARPVADGVYCLTFGEIDGGVDMDEDILLNWPDGSEDVIHYHCSNHVEWPSPRCKRYWKLNGVKQDRSDFTFYNKSLSE